jgi:hypothetical protein
VVRKKERVETNQKWQKKPKVGKKMQNPTRVVSRILPSFSQRYDSDSLDALDSLSSCCALSILAHFQSALLVAAAVEAVDLPSLSVVYPHNQQEGEWHDKQER